MSPAEAKRLISEIAQESERVFISPHAQERMDDHGIDRLDVQRCLINGTIEEGPYNPKIASTNWRVRMAGVVAGQRIKVVAEIAENDAEQVIVITAF
ncbi:MAG: DUF4258 domain-containing protein [Xanthomonadaceae bacterium]|nr:DUF4258 domain-containing protein [Xanthomonadaceae bacterium]